MEHSRISRNLIIITSDELRADSLGFMGNPVVETPNLDAFARQSTVFENHFCNFPKCVPSRISLFTGRRPHTDGYRDIFLHLDPKAPDLKSWAQRNGYQTALFGKSHCWQGKDFDDFVDIHSWSPKMMPFWERRDPEVLHYLDFGDSENHDSRRVARSEGTSNDEIYIQQASHYLREERPFSRPFMMVLNLEKPHTPYAVSEPYFSMYDRDQLPSFPPNLPEGAPLSLKAQHTVRANKIPEENLREIQAVYYGMITKIDYLIGTLLETIKSLDLLSNSIVLFVSDHGDWASQFGLSEKWDTSFNDCLTKVPCILHSPDLEPGIQITSLSEMIDLTPTLMGLLKQKPDWPVHGKDLRDVIAGKAEKDAVYCEGGHEQEARERFHAIHGKARIRSRGMLLDKQDTYRQFPDSMARARMIRTRTHKMIIRETGDHELYDLLNDPWELVNIWGKAGTESLTHELQLKMLLENLRTDPDQPRMDCVGA